eukprot:11174467-Ditylum_brightwellii.AAC.1
MVEAFCLLWAVAFYKMVEAFCLMWAVLCALFPPMEGKLCPSKEASAMTAPLTIIFFCLPGKEDTMSRGLCGMMGELGQCWEDAAVLWEGTDLVAKGGWMME